MISGLLNFVKRRDIGKYHVVIIVTTVLLVSLYWKYTHNIEILKEKYIALSASENHQTANSIQHQFRVIEQGLRTISHLPDIKSITNLDFHLSKNTTITIKEIYNTLSENIALSEIYITLHDDSIETGKLVKPVLEFDGYIHQDEHDDQKEQEEYEVINDHIATFKSKLSHREDGDNTYEPMLVSKEIEVCDISARGVAIDDGLKKGIVLSKPIFNDKGNMIGVISAVLRSDVIRAMLPDKYDYIASANDNLFITHPQAMNQYNKEALSIHHSHEQEQEQEIILYNKIRIPVNSINMDLYFVSHHPDSLFWNLPNVKNENLFFAYSSFVVILLCGFVLIYMNRTERTKKAEDEMLRHASHLNAVFNTVLESIITIDEKGTVIDCNPAIEFLSGYMVEELKGHNVNALMPPSVAEHHDLYLKNYLRTNIPNIIGVGREVELRHKDGHLVPVDLSVTEFKKGDTTFFVGTLRDISVQKEMISMVEKARDTALESSRIKSEFLSNMSHELRTPMNGIIGFIQLLEDTKLDDEQKAYLDTILDSANGLMTIINDVLDFTRLGAGKIRIENTDFNLRMTIDSLIDFFKYQSECSRIKLQGQISSRVPMQLVGPPGRLRQILVNFVSNAFKYTEQGEINIRVNMLEEHDDYVLLITEVEDTGVGITEENQKLIFDSFRQVDSSITRQHQGLGLGLAITKSLVEMMGGEIGVKSEPGKGSTFWFTMQLGKADMPSYNNESISLLNGKSILIIDDDAESAEALQYKLSSCNATTETVFSPLDAIQLLRDKSITDHPFDMLVVDVKSGLIDWRDIITTIDKDELIKPVRKVVLTSSGQRGFGDLAKQIGVMAYITKPIDDNGLLTALSMVVGKELNDTESLITKYTISEYCAKQSGRILIVDDNVTIQKEVAHVLSSDGLRSDIAFSDADALLSLDHIEYSMIIINSASGQINVEEFVSNVRIHDKVSNISHPIIALVDENDSIMTERCMKAGVDDVLVYPFNAEQFNAKMLNLMSKAS
ncbi:MAG: ATP-binding protein [Candidatus Heimdallarchaeota archaeon]|nr:ATP-binding protein [Candidatus Heimdallarchaeota archaeon]